MKNEQEINQTARFNTVNTANTANTANAVRAVNTVNAVNAASNDVIEIDLRELFFAARKKLWLIIMVAVLGAGIGAFISKVILKPVYTSTSMIYIMTKENAITQLADLQIGTQLTQDYKVLITSRTVMQNTVDHLGLNYNYVQLRNKINVENPKDTRILNISVEDGDPTTAKTIADEVARSASDYISEIMEQDPPKIVEQGEVPLYKTRPHTARNTMVGAFLGALLVMGLIVIEMVQDDTVKTEDDIEKYFNVPVLAVVPLREGEDKKGKQAKEENLKEKAKTEGKSHRRPDGRKAI